MANRRRNVTSSKSISQPNQIGSVVQEQQPQIVLDQEQQEKFEYELAWCIRKINSGLASEKDTRKISDANKLLNSLRSPSVPLIKKRQLMFSMFGDYRAKIKKEESKNKIDLNKLKLIDATKSKELIKKSKYIRKSNKKLDKNKNSSSSNDKIESNLENLNLNEKETTSQTFEVTKSDSNKETSLKGGVPSNYFKISTGNSAFKFNFFKTIQKK